jgi:ATP-dependent Lhr-like helicase
LVDQTIDDCLHGAMDIDALEHTLAALERGEVVMHTRDLTSPSPLAREILTARPYAFLDDAPLEERRTQAVMNRRLLDADTARSLGALDPDAIALVREQAWPSFESADEAHDALNVAVALPDAELRAHDADLAHLHALQASGRACVLEIGERRALWVAAEHLHMLRVLYPDAPSTPQLNLPAQLCTATFEREQAVRELVRGRLDIVGPTTAQAESATLALPLDDVRAALAGLEAEGSVLQGHFTPDTAEVEYCERRLLSRIHRSTLERLRREIEPVSIQVLLRFLLQWQRVTEDERVSGPEGLAAVLEQLQGHAAPAQAWEADILTARCRDYEPGWLDQLSFSGRFVWARLSEPSGSPRAGSLKIAPIAIVPREALGAFLRRDPEHAPQWSSAAESVRTVLQERGPRFHHELQRLSGLLPSQLDNALSELMAGGEVSSDGFAGLRALLRARASSSSSVPRRLRAAASNMAHAGRFWLVSSVSEPLAPEAALELHARSLLLRYGVVFRRLLDRESCPPWRDLVRVFRRMEARGELRGGRFVQAMTGEQFALPDAVTRLRKVRSEQPSGALIGVHAADPCNPLGTLISGAKLPAVAKNRVVLRDGVPVAVLEAGEIRFLTELDPAAQWEVSLALRRPSASTAQSRTAM